MQRRQEAKLRRSPGHAASGVACLPRLMRCILGLFVPGCMPAQVWAMPPELPVALNALHAAAEALPERLPRSDGLHASSSGEANQAPAGDAPPWRDIVASVGQESLQEAGLAEPPTPLQGYPAALHVVGQPDGESCRNVPVTVLVVTPFYIPAVMHVSLPVPCEPADAARSVVRALHHERPPSVDAIVHVDPQPSEAYASFVLFPEWATFAGLVTVMLDLRFAVMGGDGPVVGAYLTRPTTEAEIRREAGMFSIGGCDIFIGDSREPLQPGVPVYLRHGVLVRLVRSEYEARPLPTLGAIISSPECTGFPGGPPTILPARSLMLLHTSGRYLFSGAREPGVSLQLAAARFVGADPAIATYHAPGDGCLEQFSYRGTTVRGVLAIVEHDDTAGDHPVVVFLDMRALAASVQFLLLPDGRVTRNELLDVLPRSPPPGWKLVVSGGRKRRGFIQVVHRETLVLAFVPEDAEAFSLSSESSPDPDEGEESEDDEDASDHSQASTRSRSRTRGAQEKQPSPSSDHSYHGLQSKEVSGSPSDLVVRVNAPVYATLNYVEGDSWLDGWSTPVPVQSKQADWSIDGVRDFAAVMDFLACKDGGAECACHAFCVQLRQPEHERSASYPLDLSILGSILDRASITGRPSPRFRLPSWAIPVPLFAAQPVVGQGPFLATVFIYALEIFPETLVVPLHTDMGFEAVVAAVQAARGEESRRRFPRIVPVRPQPVPYCAMFVAIASWSNAVHVLFDGSRHTGAIFCAQVPPVLDRGSLIAIADVPPTPDLEVYVGDHPQPLLPGETIQVSLGTCVNFVPANLPHFAVAYFEDMVRSTQGWMQNVSPPQLRGQWLYLVPDGEPSFLFVDPDRRLHFRADIATHLDYSLSAMSVHPVVPRIRDYFDYGIRAQHVFVATQQPLVDPTSEVPRCPFLLDLRPIQCGITWGFAEGSQVRVADLVSRFEAFCPAGHYASISGGRARHEDDGVYFDIVPGTVLVVDFREQPAISSDSQGSEDSDSTDESDTHSESSSDTVMSDAAHAPAPGADGVTVPTSPRGDAARYRQSCSKPSCGKDVIWAQGFLQHVSAVDTPGVIPVCLLRPGQDEPLGSLCGSFTWSDAVGIVSSRLLRPALLCALLCGLSFCWPGFEQLCSGSAFGMDPVWHAVRLLRGLTYVRLGLHCCFGCIGGRCTRSLGIALWFCVILLHVPSVLAVSPGHVQAPVAPACHTAWESALPHLFLPRGVPTLYPSTTVQRPHRRPLPTPSRSTRAPPVVHPGVVFSAGAAKALPSPPGAVHGPLGQAYVKLADAVPVSSFQQQVLCLYDIVPGCEGPTLPQNLCDWLDNDLSVLCTDQSVPLAKRKLFSAIQLWRDVHETVAPAAVVVYTDGSANAGCQTSGSLPAAWAVSVWVLGDKEYLLGGAADTFAPTDDRRFIGAIDEVPIVSEQLALAWGLVWIIQYAPSLQLPVVLRYGCQAAGRGAFGAARAPCAAGEGSPSRLSMFVCHLRQLACARVTLSHDHVRAHQGHTPNELCDELAKLARRVPASTCSDLLPAWPGLLFGHPLQAWAWLPPEGTADLPALFSFESEAGRLQQLDLVGDVPPSMGYCAAKGSQAKVVYNHVFVSFNVLTLLDPKPGSTQNGQKSQPGLRVVAKRELLKRQFLSRDVLLVGLQETRLREAATLPDAQFFMWHAPADPHGHFGVALWANRDRPYAYQDDQPLYFQPRHFTVTLCDPRLLIVQLTAPQLLWTVVVAHAPSEPPAEPGSAHAFWRRCQQALHRRPKGSEVILLADTNARIGSLQSEAVGNIDPDEESRTGHALHQFLAEEQLWLPSTFSSCQQGPSPTWISPSGQAFRIDFVGIPLSWPCSGVSASVWLDFESLQVRDDHYPVTLQVRQQADSGSPGQGCYRRSAVRPGRVQPSEEYLRGISNLVHAPAVRWDVGVDQHFAHVAKTWSRLGSDLCDDVERRPRQSYLSEATMRLVTWRKAWRQQLSLRKQQASERAQAATFLAWLCAVRGELLSPDQANALRSWARGVDAEVGQAAMLIFRLGKYVKAAAKRDRVAYLAGLVEAVSLSDLRDPKTLFQRVRRAFPQARSSRRPLFCPLPAVEKADGELATCTEERLECWRAHFAAQEAGDRIDAQDYVQALRDQKADYHEGLRSGIGPVFDIACVPTLGSVEQTLVQLPMGKASGYDGITGELLRVHVPSSARLLVPVYAKAALGLYEPLEFRGGALVPLAKKAATLLSCDRFRSILVSSLPGKIYHRQLRTLLLPSLQSVRGDTQAGAVPGISTEAIAMVARTFRSVAAARGQAWALTFFDVRAAYYRVLRQVLLDVRDTEAALRKLLYDLGVPGEALSELFQRLSSIGALSSTGAPEHLQQILSDALQGTWFRLDFGYALTLTHRGVRPGDSLADVLFAFTFSAYLASAERALEKAGVSTEMPQCSERSLWPEHEEPASLACGSWADDFVQMTQQTCNRSLSGRVVKIVTVFVEQAESVGIELTFAVDKTASMLSHTEGQTPPRAVRRGWQFLDDLQFGVRKVFQAAYHRSLPSSGRHCHCVGDSRA